MEIVLTEGVLMVMLLGTLALAILVSWIMDVIDGHFVLICGVIFVCALLLVPVKKQYEIPVKWAYEKMEYNGKHIVYVFATDSVYKDYTKEFTAYLAYTTIDTLSYPLLKSYHSAVGELATGIVLRKDE